MTTHITEGQVALPNIEANIEAALAGDSHEWGYLFALAGFLLSQGHALPEPLRSVIADRLTAVGGFLTQPKMGDLRQVVDVLVGARGPRKTGPRKRVDRTQLAAEAAADILARDAGYGRRKVVTEAVAAMAQVSVEGVDKRLNAVRRAKRNNT